MGTPTDQGAYVTGKAFIPFFYGSDRYEVVYKGQGRLIFAGSSGFDSNAHLIWIIHRGISCGVGLQTTARQASRRLKTQARRLQAGEIR